MPSTIEDLSKELGDSIRGMIITSATDGSPIVPTAGVLRHLVALTIGTRHPGMREALNDTTGPLSEFHQALQAVESSGVSEVTGQMALTAGEGGSKVQDFGLSSTSIPVATAATPSEVNAQVIQHEQLAHFHQAAAQKRVKDNSNRPNGLDEFIIEHTPRCLQTTGVARLFAQAQKENTRNATNSLLGSLYDRNTSGQCAENAAQRWGQTDLISTLVAEDAHPDTENLGVKKDDTVFGPDSLVDLSAVSIGTYGGSTFRDLLPGGVAVQEAQKKIEERKARPSPQNSSASTAWSSICCLSPPSLSIDAEVSTARLKSITLDGISEN